MDNYNKYVGDKKKLARITEAFGGGGPGEQMGPPRQPGLASPRQPSAADAPQGELWIDRWRRRDINSYDPNANMPY